MVVYPLAYRQVLLSPLVLPVLRRESENVIWRVPDSLLRLTHHRYQQKMRMPCFSGKVWTWKFGGISRVWVSSIQLEQAKQKIQTVWRTPLPSGVLTDYQQQCRYLFFTCFLQPWLYSSPLPLGSEHLLQMYYTGLPFNSALTLFWSQSCQITDNESLMLLEWDGDEAATNTSLSSNLCKHWLGERGKCK